MRAPAPLSAAVIYGLLAVTHSLPAPTNLENTEYGSPSSIGLIEKGSGPFTNALSTYPNSEYGEHHSLDRRMQGMKNRLKNFSIRKKDKSTTEASTSHSLGSGSNTQPAPAREKTPEERGKERIIALDQVLRDPNPRPDSFADFERKFPKYAWQTNPTEPGVWESKFYPKLEGDKLPYTPSWQGTVDTRTGTFSMTREGEYRKGGLAETIHLGFPIEQRIYTSDFIARSWKEFGGGNPMLKNKVTDIKNTELTNPLDEWAATKGFTLRFDENSPEWPFIMGSSAGAPLSKALETHPTLFHKHRPTEVTFKKGGNGDGNGMWQAEFTLAPGPKPIARA